MRNPFRLSGVPNSLCGFIVCSVEKLLDIGCNFLTDDFVKKKTCFFWGRELFNLGALLLPLYLFRNIERFVFFESVINLLFVIQDILNLKVVIKIFEFFKLKNDYVTLI